LSTQRKSYPDPIAAAEACGAYLLSQLETAFSGEGNASLALSGGSSPKPMFDYMARAAFDWSRVRIFWVDERAVPPTDEQSNYRLVYEHLITPAHIPDRNVFRVHTELPPKEAARRYSADLLESFGTGEDVLPRFDVIHLGMGADAHTASLFPGEPLLEDRDNLTGAVYVEKIAQWRITLLPGVLLAARQIAVLVTGSDKAQALQHVFRGSYSPLEYPAQILTHDARHTTWFMDEASSQSLD
jgi:6-phosphogluconolactonase